MLLSHTQSEELANKDIPTKVGSKVPPTTPEVVDKDQKEGGESKTEGTETVAKKDAPVTNNYTTVMQKGANINITNINNHHTYVIYR